MSGGLASSHLVIPPCFQSPSQAQFQADANNMSARKRKADEELPDPSQDRMSFSPSPSIQPRPAPQPQPTSRTVKRARTNQTGRPLALPRLLETLNVDEMRTLLRSICDRHPQIGSDIISTAPRPSVSSAISVLRSYQASVRESFPYGDRPTSEYAYNRVKPALMNLLEALNDFTPHFLPPNESQPATSFAFLDAATNIIHQLPEWESYQHNRHKHESYEDIARSWASVILEAAKKGAGIQIQYGGWDQKLAKHNEISGGKMQEAVTQLQATTGWIGNGPPATGSDPSEQQSGMSIRQQLMNGTYGANNPVQVGPW